MKIVSGHEGMQHLRHGECNAWEMGKTTNTTSTIIHREWHFAGGIEKKGNKFGASWRLWYLCVLKSLRKGGA